MQRFWDAFRKMQRFGLVGDAGLGGAVFGIVCITLSVVGGFEGSPYGVPKVILYGVAFGVSAMLISHASGWMPEVEQTDRQR
jgi:multisubunit Na+/H+ antiporter MnhG subunit